ncbi:MAG: glyoxylate/hydroxypyruvate reductase A [Spirochaetaceae bacterium]|nr:MAG: glyoxylate/hydroxypyruvate reductase A [Spirochaetaceae bacterium]
MHLLLHTTEQPEQWVAALQKELPQARIHRASDAPQCDYALVWQPPAGLFGGQPALKAVFSLGAGVDSLLTSDELPEAVPVVRVEDSGMASQMAEYALYAVLDAFREFRCYARQQRSHQWSARPPRERADFAVGVLGLGVLGSYTAQAIGALGFPVYGWSRTPRRVTGVTCLHGSSGLAEVLASARVLVVLLPLTVQTRGLLDARRLARLPHGAVLVNLARGALVAEADLLRALNEGRLAHAFLDVFSTEPLPPGHPFWDHPGITVTPHVAAQTTVAPAARQIAEKIAKLERGEPVTGVVDRRRGY